LVTAVKQEALVENLWALAGEGREDFIKRATQGRRFI
jgi:hypothetical protein